MALCWQNVLPSESRGFERSLLAARIDHCFSCHATDGKVRLTRSCNLGTEQDAVPVRVNSTYYSGKRSTCRESVSELALHAGQIPSHSQQVRTHPKMVCQ